MNETIYISPDDIEILDADYSTDLTEHFSNVPDVAKPLLLRADATLERIKQMMYSAPSFINVVKASVPQETFQAMLTSKQKRQLASGAIELMTKKDGTLLATLIDPDTKKIVSKISLKKVRLSPELTQAMASYATQMQMAQIAEQIQVVQTAIEDVRQGQEYDRLATAYSCQQKLLQAMVTNNPELKAMALLRIVSDAEDSRNLLMQSQRAKVSFIKEQPETLWGKIIAGTTPDKVDATMNELRESLGAINMVSLVEALAYQELGESEAAQNSLKYYGEFIQSVYLDTPEFVKRLDMIDPSPKNYWSRTLPKIKKRIEKLPSKLVKELLEERTNGTEKM